MAISDAILHRQPPELTDKKLPGKLKAIIRRLLEKERDKRHATAGELLGQVKDLEAFLAPGRFRLSTRAKVAVAAGLILVLASGAYLWRRASRERWALQKVVPEITRLIQNEQFLQAAELLKEARAVLPDYRTLEKLWIKATGEVTIHTEPEGADVSFREYGKDNEPWRPIGTTPLEKVRVADSLAVWRVHKDGFADMLLIDGPAMSWSARLRPLGTVPDGMLPVAGGDSSLGWPFVELPSVSVQDFLIDRYEVTNADFKKFVDAGAYANEKYWKIPFRRGGRAVSWRDAMATFKDSTGRPGPATWEGGRIPARAEDRPVSGVSWYEASALPSSSGRRCRRCTTGAGRLSLTAQR